jgi:hypothetical protein
MWCRDTPLGVAKVTPHGIRVGNRWGQHDRVESRQSSIIIRWFCGTDKDPGLRRRAIVRRHAWFGDISPAFPTSGSMSISGSIHRYASLSVDNRVHHLESNIQVASVIPIPTLETGPIVSEAEM